MALLRWVGWLGGWVGAGRSRCGCGSLQAVHCAARMSHSAVRATGTCRRARPQGHGLERGQSSGAEREGRGAGQGARAVRQGGGGGMCAARARLQPRPRPGSRALAAGPPPACCYCLTARLLPLPRTLQAAAAAGPGRGTSAGAAEQEVHQTRYGGAVQARSCCPAAAAARAGGHTACATAHRHERVQARPETGRTWCTLTLRA